MCCMGSILGHQIVWEGIGFASIPLHVIFFVYAGPSHMRGFAEDQENLNSLPQAGHLGRKEL